MVIFGHILFDYLYPLSSLEPVGVNVVFKIKIDLGCEQIKFQSNLRLVQYIGDFTKAVPKIDSKIGQIEIVFAPKTQGNVFLQFSLCLFQIKSCKLYKKVKKYLGD